MGRNAKIAIGAFVLMLISPFAFVSCMGIFGSTEDTRLQSCLTPGNDGGTASAPFSTQGLTINNGAIADDSVEIILTAHSIVRSRRDIPIHLKDRALLILLITGMVESGIHNLDYGDSDSLGWLQQRPSQGWGTAEQVMQIDYSTNKFLDVLLTVDDWETKPEGDAAQDVQRSAYPEKYADRIDEATKIVLALTGDEEQTSAGCLPVASGRLLVATYNVLGSSHTSDPGGLAPGTQRIERAYKLIVSKGFTVVGLQELQRDQRKRLRELLGSEWGIWPKQPTYTDAGGAIHADNSIIWDKSQVKLIEGSSLPMPEYFNGKRNIPLVELEHLASGQRFFVANTHDPTDSENAFKRYRAAKQHAADSERLAAEQPTFFVGDYNSGFDLRYNENNTYQNDRNNLTWCVMTDSGTMRNAYDALKGRQGRCPEETSRERGIGPVDHVYVSQDLTVTDSQVVLDRSLTASDHPVVYAEATTTLIDQSVSGDWVLPIAKGHYTITATFGQSGPYWAADHTGLDFDSTTGEPIMAVTGGEIISAELSGAYGNRIVVRSPDGDELWYCHMSDYAVKSGSVEAGQVIGYVGATGNVSGDHLHLEVRHNGVAIDPMVVLREHGLEP